MKSAIFFHKRKAYLGESEIHLLGKKPRFQNTSYPQFHVLKMRKVFFTDVKMVSDLSAVFSIVKLVLNLDSFDRRYFLQGSDGNFQMHQKKNAEILVLELNVEFLIFLNSLL